MRTNSTRGILAASAIALTLLVAACGSEGGSDNASDDTVAPTTAASTESTTPGNPDTSLPTGEEICAGIPADVVASTLDVEVSKATASDPAADLPPTCTYAITDPEGDKTTITVSVLRPLDMLGNAGSEGYKTFVETNKEFAAGLEFEEVTVDVGRQATRFTTDTWHTAVADTGTQVVRVIVPEPEADGEQVDALLIEAVGVIG